MATIPFPGPETRVMIMNEKAQAMPDDTDDTEIHPLFAGAPSSTEFRKLRKRLVRETRAAITSVTSAADAIEKLARTIERNPNSLLLGR